MFSTIGFYCSLGLSDLFCSSSAQFREGQLLVISDKSHIFHEKAPKLMTPYLVWNADPQK